MNIQLIIIIIIHEMHVFEILSLLLYIPQRVEYLHVYIFGGAFFDPVMHHYMSMH